MREWPAGERGPKGARKGEKRREIEITKNGKNPYFSLFFEVKQKKNENNEKYSTKTINCFGDMGQKLRIMLMTKYDNSSRKIPKMTKFE